MKQITESQIKQLIMPLLNREEVELCGVRVSESMESPLIQLFVDYTEGHITIGHCTRLNRLVQEILELTDDIEPTHRLEVSSPGIYWPLTELWQFRKNLGRLIQFYAVPDDGSDGAVVEGRIISVSDDGKIKIDQANDSIVKSYQDLSGAKVIIELFSKKKPRKLNEK